MSADPLNAYVGPDVAVDHTDEGPLSGLTFAAKDLFDVGGHVTGFGSPDWARTHVPAERHCDAVTALLAAGADLRGKTHTEELAYALIGENAHYGAPVNPNAEGRVAGGSSSGSASVVAAGKVDFALGTDTGGSVRIPASFCGIFGLRPTHGRVSKRGVAPLADTFDTVGWFARDPALMRRVGEVLVPGWKTAPAVERLVVAEDAFRFAGPAVQAALEPAIQALEARIGPADRVTLLPDGYEETFGLYVGAQGYEVWQEHGDWIEREKPNLGLGTRSRIDHCRTLTAEDKAQGEAGRARLREAVDAVAHPGTVVLMPAAPGPAPKLGEAERNPELRRKILEISALSPLTGVPQYSLPVARIEGVPLGLGVLAAKGGDEMLLTFAESVCGTSEKGCAPILRTG